MVAFSVASSTREAFGAYLPSWAKYDFAAELPAPSVPVKAIVGRARPGARPGHDQRHLGAAAARQRGGRAEQRRSLRDVRGARRAGDEHREDAPARHLESAARSRDVRRRRAVRRDRGAARGRAGRLGGRAGAAGSPRRARATTWCCRTALVQQVLKDPATFSSAAGGTQIRDPASATDLAYVQRMMLNMDPPDHSRLRTMISRVLHAARGPRTRGRHRGARVPHRRPHARRPARVRLRQGRRRRPAVAHARRRARRPGRGPLADVRLVEPGDRLPRRRLRGVRVLRRRAAAATLARTRRPRCVPNRTRTGGCRTRAAAPACPTSTATRTCSPRRSAPNPGADVMSILMAQDDGAIEVEEFENLFWLFAVAGNETLRNGLPGGMIALLAHDDAQRALRDDPALLDTRGRRDVALVDAGDGVPPHRDPRRRARRHAGPRRRQGRRLVPRREPRSRRCTTVRTSSTCAARPTRTWSSGTARTSASARTSPAPRCARCSASCCAARPGSRRRASPPSCGRTSSAG